MAAAAWSTSPSPPGTTTSTLTTEVTPSPAAPSASRSETLWTPARSSAPDRAWALESGPTSLRPSRWTAVRLDRPRWMSSCTAHQVSSCPALKNAVPPQNAEKKIVISRDRRAGRREEQRRWHPHCSLHAGSGRPLHRGSQIRRSGSATQVLDEQEEVQTRLHLGPRSARLDVK